MSATVDRRALVAFCRPGFESESAQELTALAAARSVHGYARTERTSGLVEFVPTPDDGLDVLLRRFGWLRDLRSQPRPPALFGFSALLLSCTGWNELARIVMEQDERVINPIRLVLRKSRELRNVHRILLWTKHTEVRTPVRQQRIGADQVLWQSPRIRMTRHVIVQRRPRSPSVGILYVRR